MYFRSLSFATEHSGVGPVLKLGSEHVTPSNACRAAPLALPREFHRHMPWHSIFHNRENFQAYRVWVVSRETRSKRPLPMQGCCHGWVEVHRE